MTQDSVATLPWLLAVGLPPMLALLLIAPGLRRLVRLVAPWAALPAFGLALTAPLEVVVDAPLVLGMQFGLTATTRVFVLFTAVVWILAGVFGQTYLAADRHASRFWGAYLLAMTGNLGVGLVRDLVSFYLFFATMSFAAYALVIHEGTPLARRAARIYLILVVVGEACLLPALMLTGAAVGGVSLADVPAAIAASPRRDLIIGLFLAGFGIKAGAIPLHIWLPLAHPAAPTPASAVLSGTMIKTGLLGWLLFLPLGQFALPGWGTLCIVVGLAAAFYGVAIGVMQEHPKTMLAYSSISQMGLMTLAVGIALSVPIAEAAARAAVVIYATHHALAKAALFLGVGVAAKPLAGWRRLLVGLGLLGAALALAGGPLTSGAVAKGYLKIATDAVTETQPLPLEPFLQLSAVATTLLMSRFLYVVWPRATQTASRLPVGLWGPWAVLLLLMFSWMLALPEGIGAVIYTAGSFSVLWPVLAGIAVAVGVWFLYRRNVLRDRPLVPEGDLLAPLSWLLVRIQLFWGSQIQPVLSAAQAGVASRRPHERPVQHLQRWIARAERRLSGWYIAGIGFVLLVTAFLILQRG